MAQNFREPIVVDEFDLANGYYIHLPPVSLDQLEKVLGWFDALGIPEETGYWTGKGTDPSLNEEKYLPTEVQWSKDGFEDLFLDAALVYNFPHVARVELLNYFGFPGADVLVMYPGVRDTIMFTDVDPIGEWWPEQNGYKPAKGDTLPEGSVFTKYGMQYQKIGRQVAFYRYQVWIPTDLPRF